MAMRLPHSAFGEPRLAQKQGAVLISFSGLDGSGKSTQIEQLRSTLHNAGLRTRTLAFWDDVVVGVKYREGFVHKVYKSERGVGEPGKPVNRRDKNMRGWHLTLVRHFLYLADAINLCRVLSSERQRAGDVIILDRYIYDELANLDLRNSLSRAFVRAITKLVPQPDLALLLDADPVAAYQRKPEYPLDFMQHCRKAYFGLAEEVGNMTVVPPLDLPEAIDAVLKAAQQALTSSGRPVDLLSGNIRVA
jgi:thymidylate kinase